MEYNDITTLPVIGGALIVLAAAVLLFRKITMGNTLDGYVYRLQNNDPELTEINLDEDGIEKIGDVGVARVAAALVGNDVLTSLDLNGMSIGDEGAEKLASVLLLNDTLSLIRLHRNKIGRKGALALAVALRHNHTVTTMYISPSMNSLKGDDGRLVNDEIQRMVTLNKAGPEEAAKQKAALFGPGWVGEGIKLKKKAEEDLAECAKKLSPSQSEHEKSE